MRPLMVWFLARKRITYTFTHLLIRVAPTDAGKWRQQGISIPTGPLRSFLLRFGIAGVVLTLLLLSCAMLLSVSHFSVFPLVSNTLRAVLVMEALSTSDVASSGLFSCRPVLSVVEDPFLGWFWARKCEGLYAGKLCEIWIACQGLVLLSSSTRNHKVVQTVHKLCRSVIAGSSFIADGTSKIVLGVHKF